MAKSPDLTKYSLNELKTLQSDIDRAITEMEKTRKAEALEAAEAAARKMGFSLAELTGGSGQRKGKTKSATPPKYRHPENPAVTWSGRGRRPAWFMEAVAAGKAPEDLAV